MPRSAPPLPTCGGAMLTDAQRHATKGEGKGDDARRKFERFWQVAEICPSLDSGTPTDQPAHLSTGSRGKSPSQSTKTQSGIPRHSPAFPRNSGPQPRPVMRPS